LGNVLGNVTYLCQNSADVPKVAPDFENKQYVLVVKEPQYEIPKWKRDKCRYAGRFSNGIGCNCGKRDDTM